MKNLTVKKMKMSILIVILLSLQFALFAQNKSDYITPIDKINVNLAENQERKLERLENNPEYKSIQFVEIGKLQDFIDNSELTFNIPGTEGKYVALVKEFDYTSPNDFIWKGDLIDLYGSIVIFNEKGNMFGHIIIENQEYEFQSFDDKTVFIEFDHEYLSKSKCGIDHNHEFEENLSPLGLNENDFEGKSCTGLVRVLVLYTSAAQSSVSNIYNTATLAVNSVRDALNNSDISWGELHLAKAGTVHLNFIEDGDDYQTDLTRLLNNTQAHQLRNQYQADLVVLLTDNVYPEIYGVAYLGPNPYTSYSIVEAPHATSGFTFAHEVGHLFGCRHEVDDDPGGSFEHGYKFTTGWWLWKKKWKTILQTNSWSSYTRIQYYSNPDVEYNNKATGTASTNDNARKLIDESCTVENFRPYDPPPSVYISGPSQGNNSGTYTWTAHGSGGQPPYSYLWKYSLDGTNYNGTFGTGQSVTGQLPLDNDLYLKVILTDNNQQQANDYFVTINRDAHFGHKFTVDSSGFDSNEKLQNSAILLKSTKVEEFSLKTLYPNPTKNNTTVKYSLDHSGNVEISIINSYGIVIQSQEENHSTKGVFYKTLDTSKLKNGIYFVKVSSGERQVIHKLIIQ